MLPTKYKHKPSQEMITEFIHPRKLKANDPDEILIKGKMEDLRSLNSKMKG